MTDETAPPVFDTDSFMADYRAFEQRAADLMPVNKANLFAALAAAGITCVTVTFDGYGDSGQIENIEARAGETIATLPGTSVEIAQAEFRTEEISRETLPVGEALEALSYMLLEANHCGWGNNEGAFGEFVFDVTAGSLVLDFNYRVETTENHTHEF